MAVTNSITFLSYTGICVTLLQIVRRTRRFIARDWAWLVTGFALFIVACGSTHLMEVLTTWFPFFWIDATTNIITAGLSAYVAIVLSRRAKTIAYGIDEYAGRLADTEQEKRAMQESLIASEKLKEWSRMSAVVAHEIANPLEAIQNLLYLISETEAASPSVVEFARSAHEETERVLAISRSTLSFFRQGADPEPIDLLGAADSVRVLLEGVMRKREIPLQIETRGDVVVQALPGEPRQVLLNLVRNAFEASSGSGAPVQLVLEGRDAGVEIVVADHGVGVDPASLQRVFEFGYTTKGQHGNGMGLWAVRQIVSRHGGEIRIDSEPGRGTRFTLWWPRKFGQVLSVAASHV